MNIVIIAAGVLGLAVVAYALVDLAIDAVKRRRVVDVAVALVIAVATVWALLAFGDHLLK
jgi:hypothetical protein